MEMVDCICKFCGQPFQDEFLGPSGREKRNYRTVCDSCKESKQYLANKTRRLSRASQGLCTQCGLPVEPGDSRCFYHKVVGAMWARKNRKSRQSQRDYRSQIKESRRSSLQCTICKDPSESGLCQKCSDKARAWRRFRKKSILDYYGGTCRCCGEHRLDFLSLDHVNDDGARHRRDIGGSHLYQWVINKGFPPGLQTMCFNCNHGRFINKGPCPHLTDRSHATLHPVVQDDSY